MILLISGGNRYWIGLSDEASEGKWKWPHSQIIATYFNWKGREPDGGTSQNCATANARDDAWYDYVCGRNQPFICEES